MSSIKVALKAAKSALDAHNFEEAVTQVRAVLDTDAQNYFGHVFLGRALEKLGNITEAEEAYTAASTIKPGEELAWKGLCNTLEVQGSKKVSQYIFAAQNLAQIYAAAGDKDQCQSTIDKCVTFAKAHGTRKEFKEALALQLPTSPIYDILEGRVPHPAHTYIRLAEITELEEKERINKEVGEKRTRLGAKVVQVTADAKREVFSNSDLENIYQEVINWSSDDDIRRLYEEKLLQRAYDLLLVLCPEEKKEKRTQVIKLAHDMVVIKHPYSLAWSLELEWKDIESIEELDIGVLYEYMEFYPDDGLSKIIKAHIGEERVFAPVGESSEGPQDTSETSKVIDPAERLFLLTEGLEDRKESPFAHRVVGHYFLQIGEYETCAEISRRGIELLQSERRKSGLSLQRNLDAVNTNLATSLVYFQSPKNHPESRELFEDVLQRLPNSTPALLGVGMIYEEQEEYKKAVEFLDRAHLRDPDNIIIAAEVAWCRALGGELEKGLDSLLTCRSELKTTDSKSRQLKAKVCYRIGKCMWDMSDERASRKDRQGPYAQFVAALKLDPDFAPAFTALGIYYADYARDKKRARQCFQKAFELSPSEILAAERLSRLFADQGDWDLVEIVAQRTIDSGVAKTPPGSKKQSVSWPFAALGVCQIGKQEYHQSIKSFQTALRISPNDYHSWVGLGESYSNSGRYNAAVKALGVAIGLTKGENADNRWFAHYMLANVHRELGNFEEALDGYDKVQKEKSDEFGVLIAKLQTLVEQAWRYIETGFFGRAAQSARAAISTAKAVQDLQPNAFNLWKAIGDACAVFSTTPNTNEVPHSDILSLLTNDLHGIRELNDQPDIETLCDDGISIESLSGSIGTSLRDSVRICMTYCILAHKRTIRCTQDQHAQAVAWYNLGWGERRMQHIKKSLNDHTESARFGTAAVQCFKRAIELEAGNAEFWNALGIVTTSLNLKVAQHSFVRSLHIDERSARTWTNLGTLYLLQNDHELAHNAFARAQSTDPEYAQAWIGEGLLALFLDDPKEALSHFTHAFEIADASCTPAKSLYAQSAFDSLQFRDHIKASDLVAPIFALRQLQNQVLDVEPYRHILALLYERVGDHATAIEQLELVCKATEELYEVSESDADAEHFARAMADLARNRIIAGDSDQAIEDATTAQDLTVQDSTKSSAQLVIDVASGKQALGPAEDSEPPYDPATTILRAPWEPRGWNMLEDLADNAYVRKIALLNSLQAPSGFALDPMRLSTAFARVGTARNAQCAIVVCPWEESSWKALKDAVVQVG